MFSKLYLISVHLFSFVESGLKCVGRLDQSGMSHKSSMEETWIRVDETWINHG